MLDVESQQARCAVRILETLDVAGSIAEVYGSPDQPGPRESLRTGGRLPQEVERLARLACDVALAARVRKEPGSESALRVEQARLARVLDMLASYRTTPKSEILLQDQQASTWMLSDE